jgi:hypothetical protein
MQILQIFNWIVEILYGLWGEEKIIIIIINNNMNGKKLVYYVI